MSKTDERTNRDGRKEMSRRALSIGLVSAAGALLAACNVRRPPLLVPPPPPGLRPVHAGPPRHAPAHGYRRRHVSGVSLEFNAPLGVYAVVGLPGVYFSDGVFLRITNGVWYRSDNPRRGWRYAEGYGVPPGLARRYGRGHRPRGHHREHEREERWEHGRGHRRRRGDD